MKKKMVTLALLLALSSTAIANQKFTFEISDDNLELKTVNEVALVSSCVAQIFVPKFKKHLLGRMAIGAMAGVFTEILISKERNKDFNVLYCLPTFAFASYKWRF